MKLFQKWESNKSVVNALMLAAYGGIGALSGFWSFGGFFIVWLAIGVIMLTVIFSMNSKSQKGSDVEKAVESYKNKKASDNVKKNNLKKRYINYNQSYNSKSVMTEDKDKH